MEAPVHATPGILFRTVVAVGIALVLVPRTTMAGPVGFVFDISVDLVCPWGVSSDDPSCTALSDTFELTADFTDPPSLDSFTGSGTRTERSIWSGAQFSDVPLETLAIRSPVS